MIRLTKITDYGVVLLTHFAATHSDPADYPVLSARDLADQSGLPLPTVGKVLKILSRSDILSSQRGVNGGYRINRPPKQITIAEIITALEGPVALTDCTNSTQGLCEFESNCTLQENWRMINRVVFEALEGLTLADMKRPQRHGFAGAAPAPVKDMELR